MSAQFAFLQSGPVSYLEHFFVGSKLLCSRQCHWPRTNGNALAFLASWAFFCEDCGELWARRVCDPMPNGWRVQSQPCIKCGGGSLILSEFELEHILHPYFDEQFPYEWLKYEVFLHWRIQ